MIPLPVLQPEQPQAAAAPKPCCAQAGVGELGWTCPMHPQVIRSQPGVCDLCGMPLEPVGQEAGAAADQARERLRLAICTVLGLVLLVIAAFVSAEFGPTWSPVTFYLALFVILLVRPQGLLGKKPEL